MTARYSRRALLGGALGVGLAVEFVGQSAFAAGDPALARRRLIVIVCRGGLDGLSLSPPVGDPAYAALRGQIALAPFGASGGALKLDETFGLHPSMTAVHALALKGEARIAPAVATPDRERSHFEAQDVLESGVAKVYSSPSGWLNRALEAMGPASRARGFSMGPTAPLIMRGPVETAAWSPGLAPAADRRLPQILQDLYTGDAQLSRAFATGLATEAMGRDAQASANQMIAADASPAAMTGAAPAREAFGGALARQGQEAQARRLGETLAAFMRGDGGKQVAAVSVDNFDTHANQGAAAGQLAGRLVYLDAFIDGIAQGMGPEWRQTMIVVATEFGRTARVNGTGGTDHGTASTALLIGGAVNGRGIVGDWPTLAANRLYENRDTAPTLDMRALFKGVLREHLGIDRAALDARVFPDSRDAVPVAGLVRT